MNWQHWKCCERGTVPWVRIPPSPPSCQKPARQQGLELKVGGTSYIWIATDFGVWCRLSLLGWSTGSENAQRSNRGDYQSKPDANWFQFNHRIANSRFKIQNSKSQQNGWRRGWDSNPRNGSPFTAFPVLPIQPLLHLSRHCRFPIANCRLFGIGSQTFRRSIGNHQSEIGNVMAERVGFEPTVGANPRRFSRPLP